MYISWETCDNGRSLTGAGGYAAGCLRSKNRERDRIGAGWKLRMVILMISIGLSCAALQTFAGEALSGGRNLWPQLPGDSVSMNSVSQGDAGLPAEDDPVQGPPLEEITVPEPAVQIHLQENPPNGQRLIILDPGHGGEDEGCSRQGVLEKDLNLQIAERVRDRLEEMGYRVQMTRETDKTLGLEERVAIANDAKADLFVSIHQNSSEYTDVDGIETWYCAEWLENEFSGKRLAALIHKYTVQKTESRDRGLRDSQELYVIRETQMPSCLIETGFLSNKAERRRLCQEEYQEQLAEGIAKGIDMSLHPKTLYLTFDDGPSEENTNAILDILKEHDIKATFFLVGENVERYPDTAKRIAEEGHTIAIHCYNHDYEKLYKSVDSYLEDFYKAYDIVCQTTGVQAKLFRFPGGSINAYNKKVYADIIEEMTGRGFIYYDWNASLEDAVGKSTPESLITNAVESTLGRKRIVLLAHDIVYNTRLCLEDLIEALPEYNFAPLTEETAPVQF